jgi:hypothetical protein
MLVCLLVAWVGATPEGTIEGFFNTLKEGDLEGIGVFISPTPPEENMEDIDETRALAAAYFGRVHYEIHEVTTLGDRATVNLTIHYPDGRVARDAVYALAMRGAVDELAGGEGTSGEDITRLVIAIFRDEELAMLTIRTDVTLVQDDGWKILGREGVNEGLFRVFAMFGE